MVGAGPCSWAARTTSADGGSTRPWPPRARRCPIASARWRSPTSSAERGAVRSTCRRCRTAPPGSWRPWLSWPATVSYTHLRAHETRHDLVCRLLLEKKKKNNKKKKKKKKTNKQKKKTQNKIKKK